MNVVTMATIGYGDYYPLTNFGKLFCVISCIFGIFILSMLVAVITLSVFLDPEEHRAYFKLMEKDYIYTNMSNEIKSVFDIVGEIYKFRKLKNRSEQENVNLDHLRLLLKFRLDKFNKKKRLLGLVEKGTDKFFNSFDKHLDFDLANCASATINIIKLEKKIFEMSTKQVEIDMVCSDSKSIANRMANLANLMRVLSTCGNLTDINHIEGGRLFNHTSIVKYYRKFFCELTEKIKHDTSNESINDLFV